MIRRHFLAAAAAAIVLVTPAFAALTAQQSADLKRITDAWNAIHTVEGQFSQVDSKGGQSTGLFYIKKPGRFRFEYNPPQQLTVTADGYTVAVEDKKLETQDRYPLVQTPLSVLVDENVTLKRDDIQITDVAHQKGAIVVNLKSLKKDAQGQLAIAFNETDLSLQYWVVRDDDGSQVTVRVSSVKPNGDIASSKFFIKDKGNDDEDHGR